MNPRRGSNTQYSKVLHSRKAITMTNAINALTPFSMCWVNLLKNAEALNRIMNSTIVLSSTGETVAVFLIKVYFLAG
jgi:hypothetical protein